MTYFLKQKHGSILTRLKTKRKPRAGFCKNILVNYTHAPAERQFFCEENESYPFVPTMDRD